MANKQAIYTCMTSAQPPPVPLKAALTSLPFWAILFSNMGNNWGFYIILTELPLYMKTMLLQDIKSVRYLLLLLLLILPSSSSSFIWLPILLPDITLSECNL